MTNGNGVVSPRSAARVAGFGYLAIFVLAIFANFVVLTGLVDPDDAAATAADIARSEGLFRAGIVAFLIVFALDVAIAWALFVVFRGVNRDVSLLAAWFRLAYTVLLGVAVVFLFLVLQVLEGAASVGAFDVAQRDAQVALLLDAFDFAWLVGLVCFGVHLALLGWLGLRSRVIPRAIPVLLVVAGAAYVLDTVANALLASYDDYADAFLAIVAVPSVVGELAFAIWLLARGGKEANVLA